MDSLQQEFSSLESLSSNNNNAQAGGSDSERTETSTIPTSEVTSDKLITEGSNEQTSGQASANDKKSQRPRSDNSNAKNQQVTSEEPSLDRNANVIPEMTTPTKLTENVQPIMVFGPQTPSKEHAADIGSSVDMPVAVQHMADDAVSNPLIQKKKTNMTSCKNRMTIYFHAVLSKDFNLDPIKDLVYIRAGSHIGTWDQNAVQLSVTGDYGEHGYMVEGSMETTKDEAMSVSIPYKYAVYKTKQQQFAFEYIYKSDSHHITNRCLFVNDQLLNKDGDWHQYDDIVCVEPSKSLLQKMKGFIPWPNQKKPLVQGREIAGRIMLGRIFELFSDLTDINLSSFLVQLNQFFANPYVYEDKVRKCNSLNYGVDEVRKMMKEFMLTSVTPQLLEDENAESVYIKDPLRAAVIVLYVFTTYTIKLDWTVLLRLCIALCLPKLNRDDFLQYWEKFSQDIAVLKGLPSSLLILTNTVKQNGNPHWILVLPLFHLIEGSTKPFETLTSGSFEFDLSWAGLQGFGVYKMNSHDKKAVVNMMKNNGHLMEVDPLVVRSCLHLMSISDLKEHSFKMNVQLLDILQVFTNKTPQEINYSNFEVRVGGVSIQVQRGRSKRGS
ncbi:E3 ubiquitin-protein ligase rnf213-alpha-like isoform X1 [Entelurus aequoreus]|uniref:E3 ubiquitin-protein ligase rnf213-alpha-like isoform X1 n=1 Tax=Entelurus aequoreus TaxID=161455 RepID=UPI002B1E89CD|nr:E3 ubiquitin-protein ligase rnf213-alpha-like isoform X1 [Entelurus aequoreus]